LLSWQIANKGVATGVDGRIKYSVRGCRMSGDMNTALGNCLLMCAMVWAYCFEKGVDAELINNGDDCVVFMEEQDMPRFRSGLEMWFTQMGFTMKVEEPVREFERIEFCQTSPVWTPEGYIMVRKFPLAMAKDCHTMLPVDQRTTRLGWLTAIGECGLAGAGGIPVYDAFYSRLLALGEGVHIGAHTALESGFSRLVAGMDRSKCKIHPRTRFSFWLAFGITPDQQEALEAHVRTVPCSIDVVLPKTIDEIAAVFPL
jgi:hypothetical protein